MAERTIRHSDLSLPVRLHLADGTVVECPKRSVLDAARAEQIQGLRGRVTHQYAAIWCALQRTGQIPKVLMGPDSLEQFFIWLGTVEDAEDLLPEVSDDGLDPTIPD